MGYSEELVCEAHARDVRIMMPNPSGFNSLVKTNTTFKNHTYVAEWIGRKVEYLAETYADGFIIDFEYVVDTYYEIEGYQIAALAALLNATMNEAIPGSMLSVATAWSPDGIDERDYDYTGMAFATSSFFVMGYSVQSQTWNRCVACGNAVPDLKHGLERFKAFGIPGYKLVLGVSWGGTEWECVNYDGTNADLRYCQLELVGTLGGYRGANCSDAVASTCGDLSVCWDGLKDSVDGSHVDTNVKLPYYNKLDDGVLKQVWYEDASSLGEKYHLARQQKIRGVGVYEFPKLNYSDTASADKIWHKFCNFFEDEC